MPGMVLPFSLNMRHFPPVPVCTGGHRQAGPFAQKLYKKTAPLKLGEPAAHPANAYCCFRQDLTGFTPKDRTGPNLHRDTA